MKKVLLIAFGLFLFISFKNYKKEDKFCWECTTQNTSSYSGNFGAYSSDAQSTQCDLTEAAIQELEAKGTSNVTETVDGETLTTRSITTCKKK